jgi:hypothetical protein
LIACVNCTQVFVNELFALLLLPFREGERCLDFFVKASVYFKWMSLIVSTPGVYSSLEQIAPGNHVKSVRCCILERNTIFVNAEVPKD